MTALNDRETLLASWRGLSAAGLRNGWQTITLGSFGPVTVLAALRYPEGQEAFLIGGVDASISRGSPLPDSKGFSVFGVPLSVAGRAGTFLAVVHTGAADLDLFATMAADVLALVTTRTDASMAELIRLSVARIAAWQRFMERDSADLLSPEEEQGLFGELIVLREQLAGETDPLASVGAWMGPLGGLHDFSIGTGAIEVKSSLVQSSFPARIGSLDQLDTNVIAPLFIAAVRLAPEPSGQTLGGLASELETLVGPHRNAAAALSDRLIAGGLHPGDHDRYPRTYKLVALRLYRVEADFPRLVRGNVPAQVTAVRYVIDLDLVPADRLRLREVRDLLRNNRK